MAEQSFYPEAPAAVECRETHISWVFLAGERAYKLRKSVVFPFLDYGTSERRRAMCEEEVRLGGRLAPRLYLGVLAVVRRDGGLSIAPADAPGAVEHVVEMVRFDERRTLAALLERGAVTDGDVRAVARLIARFHGDADPAPAGSFGPSKVSATVSENFTTLLERSAELGDPRLAAAHRFAVAFLHGRHALLARRAAAGLVRDCHGDLRAEHVVIDGREVAIFDPVEFDPALRQIDVAADFAFLVMELEEAGRADLARVLIDEYRSAGGDDGGDELLGFYAAYRAWVRAKVACLRAEELTDERSRAAELGHARRLAELGERLSWRARRPLVLVVCGTSATGKTHLARAVAAAAGLPHLTSDVVRKELAGLAPAQHALPPEYGEAASLRTYRELGERAAGHRAGAIVDATFRRRAHRDAFKTGFGGRGKAPVFVECRAPAAVIGKRARGRRTGERGGSDATEQIALGQLDEFDPLDEVEPERHVVVRTDRPLESVIDDVEAALDARLARNQ